MTAAEPVPLAKRGITLGEVSEAMSRFVETKGWYGPGSLRPQTPRNLAMSLAIEAGEVLECFQWSESAQVDRVKDELADVILYAVQLANVVGVDIERGLAEKLERNHRRQWDVDRRRPAQ